MAAVLDVDDLEEVRIGMPLPVTRARRPPAGPRGHRPRGSREADVADLRRRAHPVRPHGAHDGTRSAPSGAVNAALADAGIAWSRVGAAFGGSDSAGLADTLVAATRPHRAAVRQRQERLRDRRQRAGLARSTRSAPAWRTSSWRSGSTSTRAAPSTRCPEDWGLDDGVRPRRADGHHPVLRHEDPALHARPRDQRRGRSRWSRRRRTATAAANPRGMAAQADARRRRSSTPAWSATR